MPELPDVVAYIEALKTRIVGERLERLNILNPFVLRSVEPRIASIRSRVVLDVWPAGKRIAIAFEGDVYPVVHLMIAGRFRWREPGRKPEFGPKLILASLEFTSGTLFL